MTEAGGIADAVVGAMGAFWLARSTLGSTREPLRGPLVPARVALWSSEVFELERLGNDRVRPGRDALDHSRSLEHRHQTVALERVGIGPRLPHVDDLHRSGGGLPGRMKDQAGRPVPEQVDLGAE